MYLVGLHIYIYTATCFDVFTKLSPGNVKYFYRKAITYNIAKCLFSIQLIFQFYSIRMYVLLRAETKENQKDKIYLNIFSSTSSAKGKNIQIANK